MLGLEFGESILWKRKPSGGVLGKPTCMRKESIYLGVKGSSGEVIRGDTESVWRWRTVRRRPVDEQWSSGAVDLAVGVPRRTSEKDMNMNGEVPELIRM